MIKQILFILLVSIYANTSIGQSTITKNINQKEIALTAISEMNGLVHKAGQRTDDGTVYRYLAFEKLPSVAQHLQLQEAGIRLLDYKGNATYLPAIPISATYGGLRSRSVLALGDVLAVHKAHSDITNKSLPQYAVNGQMAKLMVQYAKHVDYGAIVRQLANANATVTASNNGYNNAVEVELPLDNIDDLLAIPAVTYVEPTAPPARADDKRGRALHRVNSLNSRTGAMEGYTGEGIAVLVRDDGAVFDHIDFKGRLDQSSSGVTRGDHGDGVAGIMAGAGNLDINNQGMAYGSDVYVIDYRSNFLDETMDLHFDENVTVTNSSYSDGCNAGYTTSSRTVDQQMFENPTLMHVFSAGNDGESDCNYGAGNRWGNITGGHKIGKNVIATANLDYRGRLEDSSSRGPTRDGRIKPDISANGFGHISTAEAQGYMTFGGTSAAAPVIAGVTAMLQEAYKTIYGEEAMAALLKAVMLNTANDLGNKGPDFKFGWGALNAHRAARVLEENRFLSGTVAQGEVATHTIEVPAGVRQVRVMTYWADQPGVTNLDHHLINDLNTALTGDNIKYEPWVLDPTPNATALDMPATKGTDNLNNMEQVAIEDPAAGSYTLTVEGIELPTGSGEYFVTWEYDFNTIEVTHPNGGENSRRLFPEVIHWDTYGDEGNFLVELLNEAGEVVKTQTADGAARMIDMTMPGELLTNAKIRVSRDGISDESDGEFIVSEYIRSIDMSEEAVMTWDAVEGAVSYNIYRLGDKYMEQVAEVQQIAGGDSAVFAVPDDVTYRINWLAVSPVFADGKEGKRSAAIPGRPAPQPVIAENMETACVGLPYTFVSASVDTLVEYDWEFGTAATPATATGPGPHQVTYATKGSKIVIMQIAYEGGTDGGFAQVPVVEGPEGDDLYKEPQGAGLYEFGSNVTKADNYAWDFGDGNTAEGEDVMHVYTELGTYDVTLTASSECGEVVITESLMVGTVSVGDLSESDITIQPNPSDGAFTVHMPGSISGQSSLKLTTIDGRLVDSRSLTTDQTTAQYQGLPTGIYQLQLIMPEGMLTKRVVVQ